MAVYDDVLAAATADDPWLHAAGEPPRYAADYELLADMLTIPRRAGSVSETGVFPRGIDLWLSHELRRAGFPTRRPGRAPRRRGCCRRTSTSCWRACPGACARLPASTCGSG